MKESLAPQHEREAEKHSHIILYHCPELYSVVVVTVTLVGIQRENRGGGGVYKAWYGMVWYGMVFTRWGPSLAVTVTLGRILKKKGSSKNTALAGLVVLGGGLTTAPRKIASRAGGRGLSYLRPRPKGLDLTYLPGVVLN